MPKSPKLKLQTTKRVMIEWHDADTSQGWDDHDTAKSGMVYSLGYIVYEDDKRINVANTVDFENGHSNCVISIPKDSIKKKRYI